MLSLVLVTKGIFLTMAAQKNNIKRNKTPRKGNVQLKSHLCHNLALTDTALAICGRLNYKIHPR